MRKKDIESIHKLFKKIYILNKNHSLKDKHIFEFIDEQINNKLQWSNNILFHKKNYDDMDVREFYQRVLNDITDNEIKIIHQSYQKYKNDQ